MRICVLLTKCARCHSGICLKNGDKFDGFHLPQEKESNSKNALRQFKIKNEKD